MNASTLNASTIRNKKKLVELYLNQFNEAYILREINNILQKTRRGITQERRRFQKRLSSREVLMFIYDNGTPDNYILSEEMQMKLADLRKSLALNRSNHEQ